MFFYLTVFSAVMLYGNHIHSGCMVHLLFGFGFFFKMNISFGIQSHLPLVNTINILLDSSCYNLFAQVIVILVVV